jgi:hypothetical protein
MSIFKEQAISKFKEGNVVDYNLPFDDFICDCYVRLKPCSYGSRIQSKIIREIKCKTIHPTENMGDIMLGNHLPTELKVSFLGQNNCYSITHVRMWQKFRYYLFCLIDCENNFEPEFYLIDKYIMNMVSLRPMNGTRKSNSENTNIELRACIKKGGDFHKLFKRENKLNGTTLGDLISFVKKVSK